MLGEAFLGFLSASRVSAVDLLRNSSAIGRDILPTILEVRDRLSTLNPDFSFRASDRPIGSNFVEHQLDQNSASISPVTSAANLPPGVQLFPNIVYEENTGLDPNLTSLDIYAPENVTNLPVMIFVHGGAWMIGDKSFVQEKPDVFTASGYIFVSINYRLFPDVGFPTFAADVADAIAWVHDNITQYGGDPDTLFLMGHSAGAHLAALVATDETYLQAQGEDLDILDGLILLDGAGYNLASSALDNALYTQVFGSDPQVLSKASPITHVESNKGIPPTQLFFVAHRQDSRRASWEFGDLLSEASVPTQIVPAFNKTHSSLNREIGEPGDVPTQQIFDFLNRTISSSSLL